jgi:hypothetical protein
MATAGPDYEVGTAPSAPASAADDASNYRWRQMSRMVGAAALLLVALAVLVNWLALGGHLAGVVTAEREVEGAATRYEPSAVPAEAPPGKAPLEMLPTVVISYETMAHQSVAGQSDRAAEAIYNSLNMDLELATPMSTYSRVEAMGSQEAAQVRVQELLGEYPVGRRNIVVNGVTPAGEGMSQDRSAYAVGWAYEGYAVFVKTSFRQTPPVRRQYEFLSGVGNPVVEAVELYQRTGQQGLQSGRS